MADATSRRNVTRAVVVATVFVLLSGGGFRYLTAALERQVGGARLPEGALRVIPLAFGLCDGEQACWRGEELQLEEEQLQRTDTDELLYRTYRAEGSGDELRLLVAYGVRPRDLQPHRPEVCYPAVGWSLQDRREVPVRISGAERLTARLQRFVRGGLSTEQVWILSYYIVDGAYASDVSLLRSRAWKPGQDFGYMTQVQITVRAAGRVDAAAAQALAFAELTADAIREVLVRATGTGAAAGDATCLQGLRTGQGMTDSTISKGDSPIPGRRPGPAWLGPAVLVLLLLWSYWPVLRSLWRDWQTDANYSVGPLVPLVALYLAWQYRDTLRSFRLAPAWIGGVALCLLALAGRAFGLLWMYESAERYSLVLMVFGLVLWVGGRQLLWRARWILLLLLLMVPLPGRVNNRVSGPLQDLATSGAVFTLEVVGISVDQQGRVMVLADEVPIAVAEACSGLRMLTAFILVAATLALVVNRPRWQRAVLVLSSIPVALACNILRLVITALLFLWTSSEVAERFFHDFAGLTMMPLAVGMLVVELWVMARLELPRES